MPYAFETKPGISDSTNLPQPFVVSMHHVLAEGAIEIRRKIVMDQRLHKNATAIRLWNNALIVNLSSLR